MSLLKSLKLRHLSAPRWCRSIIINPAVNSNPAYHFPAVLPLGLGLSDDLRAVMTARGLDSLIVPLEKFYVDQVTNDAEFNHWALPRKDSSPLWGFIYGEKLVSAQLQLNGLETDTEFLRNYLQQQISELTLKMDRYFPDLDWRAQVKFAEESGESSAYQAAHDEALCDALFADSDSAIANGEQYLQSFANNNFVAFDESDAFGDFLPEALEQRLVNYFEFCWYQSCANVSAGRYFTQMQSIESSIALPINAMAKDFRKNVGLFFLESFEAGDNDAQYVVDVLERACGSVIAPNSDKTSSELVAECLSMLDIAADGSASEKTSSAMATLIARLFFGDSSCAATLSGKSTQEVSEIVQSVDIARLALIHKALQVQKYLKHESVARLLFAALLAEYPAWFAQFAASEENIERFQSENSAGFDAVVGALQNLYDCQEQFASKFKQFMVAIASETTVDLSQQCVAAFQGFSPPDSVLVALLTSASDQCGSNSDIVGQLRYKACARYLQSNHVSWHRFVAKAINPSRQGFSGDTLAIVAQAFSTGTATDLLFGAATQTLRQRGLLTAEKAQSAKSDLMSAVADATEQVRVAAQAAEAARTGFEGACKGLRISFNDFDFEHARDSYDPLSIYLSQYKYLSPRG